MKALSPSCPEDSRTDPPPGAAAPGVIYPNSNPIHPSSLRAALHSLPVTFKTNSPLTLSRGPSPTDSPNAARLTRVSMLEHRKPAQVPNHHGSCTCEPFSMLLHQRAVHTPLFCRAASSHVFPFSSPLPHCPKREPHTMATPLALSSLFLPPSVGWPFLYSGGHLIPKLQLCALCKRWWSSKQRLLPSEASLLTSKFDSLILPAYLPSFKITEIRMIHPWPKLASPFQRW